MHKYRLLSKKGEGTFSEVLKAQNVITGEYCAIKCMRTHFRSLEQVNALREVQALRRLTPHPHIVDLIEVLYDKQSGRLALVFELMQCNVYDLIRARKTPLPPAKVKLIMYQLLKAVAHMHRHGIFHRDLKPENVLVAGDVVKVADLGSCRGVHTRQPFTEYISTRWYRAPECLLTAGHYDHRMDIWGCACLFYEILTLQPLFPGANELDQIDRIHAVLGSPPMAVLQRLKTQSPHLKNLVLREYKGTGVMQLMQGHDPNAASLMDSMLAYDPARRCSAKQALKHPYFQELREAEKQAALAQGQSKGQTPNTPGDGRLSSSGLGLGDAKENHGGNSSSNSAFPAPARRSSVPSAAGAPAGPTVSASVNASMGTGGAAGVDAKREKRRSGTGATTGVGASAGGHSSHAPSSVTGAHAVPTTYVSKSMAHSASSASLLHNSGSSSNPYSQHTAANAGAGGARSLSLAPSFSTLPLAVATNMHAGSNTQRHGQEHGKGGAGAGGGASVRELRESVGTHMHSHASTTQHGSGKEDGDSGVPEAIESLPSVFERDPRAHRSTVTHHLGAGSGMSMGMGVSGTGSGKNNVGSGSVGSLTQRLRGSTVRTGVGAGAGMVYAAPHTVTITLPSLGK